MLPVLFRASALALVLPLLAPVASASPLPLECLDAPLDERLAQAHPTLPTGRTEAALSPHAPRWTSGAPTHRFELRAEANETITLTARSTQFDTLLVLEGPGGFRAENDDAPGIGVNSRLRATLPTAGVYTVVVTSPRPAAEGAFTLDLERGTGAAVAAGAGSREIGTLRDRADGRLEPGDATLTSGEFYDTWVVQAQAGDHLLIHMDSDELDAYLIVRTPTGLVLENDDRAPGDTNATVEATFAQAGPVQVHATSYRPGETGAYRLRVETAQPVDVRARPLAAADWVQGQLSSSDPARHSGQHLHAWTFEGRAGERIVIDLESDAFDPVLTVTGPAGFHEFNDDVDVDAGNLNSRVAAALPADGTYRIEVSTWRAGEVGPYRLRRTTSDPAAAARSASAEPSLAPAGTVHQGTLAPGDERLSTGEYFDLYQIDGQAGQTVTLTMESTAIDTYLIVQGPNGYQQDNDDFGGTTNSRLEVTFPETGTYRILATSYAPGETGAYALRIAEGSIARANARGRVHLISVGISEYLSASHLPYCADDAVKLDESLRTSGLLTQESRVLTDARATRASIQGAIAQVAAAAEPDDVVIFFFSGHGDHVPNPAELNGFDETLEAWDGAILDDELAAWLDPIRARLTLVALDSCFSGGFARDVVNRPGRMGVFSSEEDVLSNVAMRFAAGGYLSLFLRDGLSGEADTAPRDGVITVGELTQYLRRQWAEHMLQETVTTGDFDTTWQNLVIDRGAVKVSDVVVYRDPAR